MYFPENNNVKRVRCVKFTDKFEGQNDMSEMPVNLVGEGPPEVDDNVENVQQDIVVENVQHDIMQEEISCKTA